ncbi:hypothetical protein F5148DRAFT_1273139 [Russula earlei]|uniref:Uncharacterized protein n=1 Tax=Russula earlei TaxID=71964 RepID=A0ACC0UQ03_9AGAM|nr:hypothetical protein F5148DRAFT_1273139 [Russula earlei]
MHLYGLTLAFLLPSLAILAADSVIAAITYPPDLTVRNLRLSQRDVGHLSFPLCARDGDQHGHGHESAPLLELNETEVLLHHAPTPPSYWSIDIDDPDPGKTRHPSLMALHALFMTSAFFGALPAGIALRSLNHAWYGVSMILFWTYEGQMHRAHAYLVLTLALILSAIDLFAGASRAITYIGAIERQGGFSIRSFWKCVILSHRDGNNTRDVNDGEYTSLVAEEREEDLEENFKTHSYSDHRFVAAAADPNIPDDETVRWVVNVRRNTPVPQDQDRVVNDIPLSRRLGQLLFATLQRFLVFAGFAQFMHGIVIYTGGCRGNYLNGCLAHVIKGGIFWCYGLATFARFLGSFSELGWAWNRAPTGHHVSAEFVESLVIFLYGITNTWMERFGAHPGDPYTTKEVQHISIAVMFWFAGLVGMGLESRRLRRWLSGGSTPSLKASSKVSAFTEPASHRGSFNPFPALVIGVTGVVMSAHFQTYLFQVQIHALWGYCLTGFAVLRCLTYFFVWLNPPHSVLPSRPPSEALASFLLACGGLLFILSDEEITFAAIRRRYDDVMMFLNLAVAITCFAFCWTMLVVAFKGWLRSRSHSAVPFHPST